MTGEWDFDGPGEAQWGPVFEKFGLAEGEWKSLAVLLLARHHPALLNLEPPPRPRGAPKRATPERDAAIRAAIAKVKADPASPAARRTTKGAAEHLLRDAAFVRLFDGNPPGLKRIMNLVGENPSKSTAE